MNQVIEDVTSLRYNRHYRIWQPFMEKYNCQRIAEIGVRDGWNFEKLIKHHPDLAVAVDIWRDDGVMARNDIALDQESLEYQYESFKSRMADQPTVRICREYSFEAVKHFPNEYFDFVYIDADHTFEGCYRDIIDWYPKVKKGGFLFGDDYRNHKTRTGVKFGVIEAVTKFCHDNYLAYFVFPISKWGLIK